MITFSDAPQHLLHRLEEQALARHFGRLDVLVVDREEARRLALASCTTRFL